MVGGSPGWAGASGGSSLDCSGEGVGCLLSEPKNLTFKPGPLLFWGFFCSIGEKSLGLAHARQALYV
jgi:hypothetical protein